MKPDHPGERAGDAPVGEVQGDTKYKSVRRVLRIMDVVSQRGEGLPAKELAHEIGTNLSSCYYLLNILVEEGYIEKIPRGGGYRMGPAIPLMAEAARSDFDPTIEPVVEELAQRAQMPAYVGVLSGGQVEVSRVKAPAKSSPVGVVEGFRGPSHALALGKVLLAGMGSEYVEEYIGDHGLEAFSPRTIVRPAQLHAHLNKVRLVGVATDFEEFAHNLCCVAAPVKGQNGKVTAAIGLATTARHARNAGQQLIDQVQWAAGEASMLLGEVAYERRNGCPS
jgi:DNA-binding IclR family transcriptional regulator